MLETFQFSYGAMFKLIGKIFIGLGLAAGLTTCANAGKSAASPPTVNQVIREMELVRERIYDLVTVVERVSRDNLSGQKVKKEIHISYKKPDKLKAEVKGARPRVVVINGSQMWVYSPDLEIVEEYTLKDEEQQMQVIYEMSWGLTSPIKSLVRGMNRSLTVLEDGSLLVELVPDQKDAQVIKIKVWVDPQTWLITEMYIFPSDQPPILLRVKEWQMNSGLEDSFFDFQVPEGADVFEPLKRSVGSIF